MKNLKRNLTYLMVLGLMVLAIVASGQDTYTSDVLSTISTGNVEQVDTIKTEPASTVIKGKYSQTL